MTNAHGHRGKWYWEKFADPSGKWKALPARRGQAARDAKPPPGEDLAALRSGLGRLAGTVPRMWGFYESIVDLDERWGRDGADNAPPPKLIAEHHALTLYAVHQQSEHRASVHRPGPDFGVGRAMRALRQSDKYRPNPEAVDRRFGAAATATSVDELAYHLRGLIGQLRTLSQVQPLDYSKLVGELERWSRPEQRHRIRMRWGGQYFAWERAAQEDTEADSEYESEEVA